MSKSLAELIVEDIRRVQGDGPFPSRDKYLELGKFPKSAIVEAFETWTKMLLIIGETFRRGKATVEEKRAERELVKFGFKESVLEKFEREVAPYHGKFDRIGTDTFMVACYTDSHSQFRDEFTEAVFLDTITKAQPELIVLGGDIFEFYRISRHNQNPQRALSMQSEIDFVVGFLKRVRAACPKSQIDYHFGNHEVRLFSYLCEKAPALSSLRCLQFDKLLSLNDLEINLVGRKNFVFSTGMKDNFKVYRGLWAWTHGTDCTIFPAHKEMARHGCSGASGHVHRHTAFAKRDVYGFKSWMTVGMAATTEVMEEYQHTLINAERGFLLAFVHKNGVTQQHISTEGGFACVGGTFYRDKVK